MADLRVYRGCVCGLSLVLALACGGKSNRDDKQTGTGGDGPVLLGGNANANGGDSQAGHAAGPSTGANGGALTNGGARAAGGATGLGGGSSKGGASSSTGSAGASNPGSVVTGPGVPTNQVDLLLMIDNSISMTDKQQVLAGSLPAMLLRLTSPNCVDAMGNPTGEKADPNGTCSRGAAEFAPVGDLHVAVITSSLGGHGSQTCSDPNADDHGQLLPLVRTDPNYPVQTWNGSGFLSWDPAARSVPPGESDLAKLTDNFKNLVLSAGQSGCGFESQLESWYRFLIDPDPPTAVPMVTDPSQSTKPIFVAPDQNPILKQRAQFLRKDSIVAVLMLTDENDCSIIDNGQGWLVGTQTLSGSTFRMPASTSACATNPNDPCCSSCLSSTVSANCAPPQQDANCKEHTYLQATNDALNLRCYNQQQRFGFTLLHPISRYVDGLTRSLVENSHPDSLGTPQFVANPLFPPGSKRTASMVFLAGIVGVPWQDLATEASLEPTSPLEYLPFGELVLQGRWDLVLGDPGDPTTPPSPPGDKLMFETPVDRTTLFASAPHPLLGAAGALAPSTATSRANAINGHETNIKRNDDLQYACIFPLQTPRAACTGAGCECDVDGLEYNRPQCDGSTQVYAKAYPSVRELRVLKGVGDITGNAITTSICPKSVTPSDAAAYGYVPAMSAIVSALKPVLK